MQPKTIYLVGGAIRSSLLNEPVSDYDYVAVGYLYDELSHLPQVGKDFPVFLASPSQLTDLDDCINPGYNHGSTYELAMARTERKTFTGTMGFATITDFTELEELIRSK